MEKRRGRTLPSHKSVKAYPFSFLRNLCTSCGGRDMKQDQHRESLNGGAATAGHDKLADWLKVAMSVDDASLSDREPVDVAANVIHT